MGSAYTSWTGLAEPILFQKATSTQNCYYGTLLHTEGVLQDASIVNQTPSSIRQVFAPKCGHALWGILDLASPRVGGADPYGQKRAKVLLSLGLKIKGVAMPADGGQKSAQMAGQEDGEI